jgi:hypothetical protein
MMLLVLGVLLQSESVPFELAENIIIAKGSLNGREATWIVDTGASGCVVTPKAARAAGIEGDRTGVARSMGAGQATVRDHRVAILEPTVADFIRKAGVDYTGILGTPYLEQFLVTLDYGAKRLILAPPDSRAPDGPGADFELKKGLIFLDVRFGDGTLRMILDCGAQAAVVLPSSAERLRIPTKPVRGRTDAFVADIDLTIGDTKAPGVIVAVQEPPQIRDMERAGLKCDGFLGFSFLGRYRTTIDYRRKRVRFEPLSKTGGPPEEPAVERPALGWSLTDAKVDGVDAGGLAEKAGFRAGDMIVSIDKQPVTLIEEIRAILTAAKAGSTFTIVVRRGSEQVTLSLKW